MTSITWAGPRYVCRSLLLFQLLKTALRDTVKCFHI